MSNVSKTTLKTYFVTGATPTEAQFGNLIDSSINVLDDVSSSLSSDSSLSVLSSSGAKNLKDALDAVDVRVVTLENAGNTFAADYYNKTEVDSKLTSIGTTIDGLPFAGQISSLDARVTSNESSIAGKSDTGHTHVIGDVTNLQSSLDSKAGIDLLNATKTDLTTAINTKVSAGHTHLMADITDLGDLDLSIYAKLTDLDGKASSSHQHLVADVTDIGSVYYNRTEVDSKIAEVSGSHTHLEADITNLDKYTQGQTNLKILDHTSLIDNPHAVTKVQVSLGNVENLSSLSLFSSPASTSYKTGIMGEVQSLVDEQKVSLGNHTSLTNNPHAVSKAQVGLGSVPDIDVKALLDAHTSSDNPHDIDLSYFDVYTKAGTVEQVTLGLDSIRYPFIPNNPTDGAGSVGDLTWGANADGNYKAYLKVAESAWRALALFKEGSDGHVDFDYNVDFKENVVIDKNLTVTGKSTLGKVEHEGSQIKSILNDLVLLSEQAKVKVDDDMVVTGELSVLKKVSLGSTLYVKSNGVIDGNLDVAGYAQLSNVSIHNSTLSTTDSSLFLLPQSTKVTGTFESTGNVSIGGNTTIGGTLDVTGCGQINNVSICSSTISTTDNSLLSLPQNVKISGQLETTGLAKIGGNLEVMGNLTVQGTQTILNTTTLDVEDNIVKLNKNVTGSPEANAGLEIERGSETNSSIYWDESVDLWRVNSKGTAKTIAFDEELDLLRTNTTSEFSNVRVSIDNFKTNTATEFSNVRASIGTFKEETATEFSNVRASIGVLDTTLTNMINLRATIVSLAAVKLDLQNQITAIVTDKYSSASGT